MQPLKLFKDMQREIRSAEKQVIALNPPKPERESKRRKKKVMADDFIDYTNLTSFNTVLEERLPDRKVKVLKVNSPQVSLVTKYQWMVFKKFMIFITSFEYHLIT